MLRTKIVENKTIFESSYFTIPELIPEELNYLFDFPEYQTKAIKNTRTSLIVLNRSGAGNKLAIEYIAKTDRSYLCVVKDGTTVTEKEITFSDILECLDEVNRQRVIDNLNIFV